MRVPRSPDPYNAGGTAGREWRRYVFTTRGAPNLTPVESLIGVLMCGLSTGYFSVVVSRIHQPKQEHAVDLSSAEGRKL